MTDTEPSAELMAAVAELVSVCDIGRIRTTKIDVELYTDEPVKANSVNMDFRTEFGSGVGVFGNRFSYEFVLTDEAEEAVAADGSCVKI